MTRSMTPACMLVVTAVLAWLAACSDYASAPDMDQESSPVIVSDASPNVVAVSAAWRREGTAGSLPPAAALQTAAEGEVAYVSLSPGAFPAGVTAVIRSPRATGTVSVAIIEGGFDPVPVAAIADDELEIAITLAGGASPVLLTRKVPARRPPRVVRTLPPRDKTDVPLNSSIVVVFSEPVSEASLASAVRLFRGATSVPGTVHLLEGTTAAVVFVPAELLDQNTRYRLDVTESVRDLAGDALAEPVSVEFATGATFAGHVDRATVLPDTVLLAIGSQVQLTATPRDSSGTPVSGHPILWSSDNPAVASVSSSGLVTAVGEGGVHIRTQFFSGVAFVVVEADIEAVASVRVTPESPIIPIGALGGTVRLSAELRGITGNLLRFRQVAWGTSDASIATVNATSGGRAIVTGFAPGAAEITATSEGRSDRVTVTIVRPGPFVRLSAGGPDSHTCGVTSDDWVLCWGSNNYGQLGTGLPGSALAPVGLGGTKLSDVVSAWQQSCALTRTGRAYCWGDNRLGRLGIGTATGPEQCFGHSPCAETPVGVAGGHEFVAIGMGDGHSCALTADGHAYCWGINAEGQLGTGSTSGPENCDNSGSVLACSTVPVRVTGGLAFTSLAVGGNAGFAGAHTCALTASGAAYCWGENAHGQLGDGTTVDRASPTPVAGGHAFVSLTIGNTHTCGLTVDGAAFCWGLNGGGELGIGSASGPDTCRQPYGTDCSKVPAPVAGGLRWAQISAGYHSCAVTQAGEAYCWGPNTFGALGTGTTLSAATPVPVSGGLTFTNVSAGSFHSCGVTTDRVAYCWGENLKGQLGTGSTTSSSVPVRVSGQP